MGMFDNLRCEQPLPKVWEPRRGIWQTKSLGCELTTYTITADGRLIRKAGGWGHGDVPEMQIPYHGDIEFHDFDRERGYIQFTARFTEGVFSRVWMEEWEPPYGRPDAQPPADA
jgi:hypothetical protein